MKQQHAVLVLLAAFGYATTQIDAMKTCTKKSDCSCETDNGKLIDLSGLGKLTYNDVTNKQDFTWEPCKTFNIGTLTSVTAAQHVQTPDLYYDIGTDPDVEFTVVDGHAQYIINAGDTKRHSFVTIICGSNTEWKFVVESPETHYNFELIIPCGESTGLSLGTVLLIVFLVLLFLYFVCGILFLTFVRKSQGVERIPNYMFWTVLPGLIRDGFKFTLSCCGRRTTAYTQI